MTSESLSQNEIDLLFGGGDGDPGAVQPDKDPLADIQVYDFHRPARISKERSRSLSAMYGLLGKSLENWVTGRVRDPVEMVLQSVEQISFGEFTLALPSPCASYLVEVDGAPQQGVVDFGRELAFHIVDRFMGGSGEQHVPDRPLSVIERQVVRIVAERAVQQLREVWKDYIELDLALGGFESIPEMLQAANREDPVLVANLDVRTEGMSSVLLLCLPFMSLEKFFTGNTDRSTRALPGTPEERAEDRATLEASVRDARLPVAARLPTFDLPIRTLADLEPGSVITTGQPADTRLDLLVGEQRRFVGFPGKVGRKLAFRIEESVEAKPEDPIRPTHTLI